MTAAGIAICGEWCQKIIYNEPSSSCGEGLFVKKGNPKGLHSYEDLIKKGGKVAIMAGAEQLRMIQAPRRLEHQRTHTPADVRRLLCPQRLATG